MKHWLICSRFITYCSGTVTGGETLDASHRTHSWISLQTYPADVLAVSNGPAVTLMIYYCLCVQLVLSQRNRINPEIKMILTHPRRVFFFLSLMKSYDSFVFRTKDLNFRFFHAQSYDFTSKHMQAPVLLLWCFIVLIFEY